MSITKDYLWGHKRPFNAASNAIKKKFGTRVQKLSVDGGFTCPNRDDNRKGGCTFCNNDSFHPSYCTPNKSIKEQLLEGKTFHESRYKNAGNYLAYFQAYSNTYDSPESLKKKYSEALELEGIIGLIIGTRPDCLSDDVLDLISQLNTQTHIVVELGIESVYDKTLERINRGHNFDTTREAYRNLNERKISSGGHLILGLPGENKQEMLASASIVSELPLHSLKLHQLQIIEGTKIADEYISKPEAFKLFEIEEYIEFIADYITRLRPDIVIDRIAGETQPWRNLGKHWGLRYDQILQKLEKYMNSNNLWQGKNWNG